MTSQEEMNERMKRNPHIVERVIAAFENDEWVEVEIDSDEINDIYTEIDDE